jgi:hypothetical protein
MSDVVQLILGLALLAALVGVLVVMTRRRERAHRRALGLDLPPRPDPEPVERAFDPALCTYCDRKGEVTCPACTRNMCDEHQPWPKSRFCYQCEAEWERGARRRGLWITPIVIGLMVSVALAIAGTVMSLVPRGNTFALVAILAPFAIAAPAYKRIEGRTRRRFRPGGRVPIATARPARRR